MDLAQMVGWVGSVGGAGAFGFLFGYGVKKLLKVLLWVVGVVCAVFGLVFAYFMSNGIITVNMEKLTQWMDTVGSTAINTVTPLFANMNVLTQNLAAFGSFGVCFALGFQKA